MSRRTTSGRVVAARPRARRGRRGPPRPGARTTSSSRARIRAPSTLSSTTSTRFGRASAGLDGRCGDRSLAGRGVGPRRPDREADDELAAPAHAVAGGGDAPAVQLDQAPDQGQADPQPPLAAVERAVGLGEQVEDAREQLRGDPDAGVADPDERLVPLAPGLERDPAPRLGVLGGVVQQVGEDLLQPGRVGLERDRLVGRARPTARGGGPRSAAGPSRRRGRRPRARSTGPLRSWILPLLIRETSSRSSTSRARCRTCRSAIVARLLGLGRSTPSEAEQVQGVQDRRQGVAQLVREHRQELVLAAVGLADLAVEPRVVDELGGLAGVELDQAGLAVGRAVGPGK